MDDLIRSIEKAYGSLERPDWSFVAKRVKDGLYDDVVKELAKLGSVQESTDQNDDCSRCLLVSSEGQALTLRLSLVGNLACVHAMDGRVLSGDQVISNVLGDKLSRLLKANRIEILDEDELRAQIDFGGGRSALYEVLFSGDDMLS
jgi:hypothetical protein